ncbi:MAG: radical SAM protein [Myxococcales bacterium]|nr:radical SAM protein [Myxococcales bacterium]
MARVLLIQPPLLLHGEFIDYPYFASAGLWQAAAMVRDAGHDVTLLDAFALPTSSLMKESNSMIRLGVPWATFTERLPAEAPDILVIANSPWQRARQATVELARFVKGIDTAWPEVTTVLADCDIGGMHYIEWGTEELDRLGIAWGQKYEPDTALPELLDTLAAGRDPETRLTLGIPGDGALDDLPLPAYDLVDMAAFQGFCGRVARAQHKREIFDCSPPLLALKTSRGCVYRCNFCTSNPWQRQGHDGRSYRTYGPEALTAHLTLLKTQYGIHRVVVLDELVNVNERHLDHLLDALESLEMRVDFPNGMRADRLTEHQVQRLAQVTNKLSVSAESASDRVANELIGKRFDLTATRQVAQWAKAAGLPMVVHWMIGQPEETRSEILTTLETAWELFEETDARPLLQFATPILGTALHQAVTEQQLWTRREDRDIGPLFQGAPSYEDRRGGTAGTEQGWTARELHVAKLAFETKLAAHKPRKIIMNTTYICNNQCVFCATGNRLPSHGDVQEQLRFMQMRRDQGYDLIDFDGGEPTTNPMLFHLLRSAKAMGYSQINLTSNGRMLMLPKNAEKIVRSGITNLLISLHGPNEQVHEEQVQSAGAFRQTVRGIANAVKLCKRYGVGFGVNVTLTKTNFPVLMEYGALLTRLGVSLCNIQFVTPFGKASAATQPDPAETALAVQRLIDTFGDRITFQVINLPLCYMAGYEEYCLGDIFKLERRMVFVSMEDVNLFDYLQSRRRHEAACKTCLVSTACEGFYYFPDSWNDEAAARWGD